MANLEACTLYVRKNRTNSYNFLQINPVHASWYTFSIDPVNVIIALLDVEIARFDFSIPCHLQYYFDVHSQKVALSSHFTRALWLSCKHGKIHS